MDKGWSILQTGVLGHRHGISMDTCARNQVVQRRDVNIHRLGRSGLVGLVPTQCLWCLGASNKKWGFRDRFDRVPSALRLRLSTSCSGDRGLLSFLEYTALPWPARVRRWFGSRNSGIRHFGHELEFDPSFLQERGSLLSLLHLGNYRSCVE